MAKLKLMQVKIEIDKKVEKNSENIENIARGTTDPGYWVCNLDPGVSILHLHCSPNLYLYLNL